METVSDFILGGSKITADGDFSHEIKKTYSWKESYDQPRQHIKKQRHYLNHKGPSSQSYGFSSSHVWMWELDHKEGWVSKNWHFQIVVLKKTLESPLEKIWTWNHPLKLFCMRLKWAAFFIPVCQLYMVSSWKWCYLLGGSPLPQRPSL